jgi:protein O-mannosyl-transferase
MKAQQMKVDSPWRLQRFAVGGAIVVLIWIVFGQTLTHDFVNYDDKTYVYDNSLVKAGLSLHGLARAFVDVQTSNWHPLTIISHMIDCQIFGLKAGAHHFTNVLLHTVAVILLFVFLVKATSRFWASAFVAALFAIHPLRVESVAWIAERKDVLSAVFFFLTLLAYIRYARAKSLGRYLTMSILFACGLMSKPMLVTTPLVLLLLDYWPLQRFAGANSTAGLREREDANRCREAGGSVWETEWSVVRDLFIEKLPLFGLSLGSAIVTFVLQEHSMGSIPQLPFSWRLENALVSYVIYLWQMIWPKDLVCFYPHPEDSLSFWQVALAAAFLAAITWLVFAVRRTRPYLIVGWLWYLIMLLPVIGIVEVGLQSHADRYTYLPQIGIYFAITWLVANAAIPYSKQIFASAAAVIVVALSACSWKQTTFWRNSETLWTHALAVTKNNDVALTNFANWFAERGELDNALSYFQRALAIHADGAHQHYNLSLAVIHDDIGNVLTRMGRLNDAIDHFREALKFRPDYPDAHYNLGVVLFQKGEIDAAMTEWRAVLSVYPNDSVARIGLANAFVQKGLFRDAVANYQSALKVEPDSVLALNNLAWLLSAGPDDSVRNGTAAVDLALKLNRVSSYTNPSFIRTLAAAYAEAGQFDKAVETAQTATGLAHAQGQHGLAAQIERESDLYRAHMPFRDPTVRNAR